MAAVLEPMPGTTARANELINSFDRSTNLKSYRYSYIKKSIIVKDLSTSVNNTAKILDQARVRRICSLACYKIALIFMFRSPSIFM